MIAPEADYKKQIEEFRMSKKSDLVRGYGLAMSIGATMEEIRLALGVTEEEFYILATPEGRPHLERMITGLKLPVEPPKPVVYLKRLYEDERIILDPTDGKRTIAQATDVFAGYIDPGFKQLGLDVPTPPTGQMELLVDEQITNGTFVDIFGSLERPLVELRFTQHQVTEFCVKHRARLHTSGYGNFFLLQRADGAFFVASVGVHAFDRLSVYVRPFSDDRVWDGSRFGHRFVFPQLIPSAA